MDFFKLNIIYSFVLAFFFVLFFQKPLKKRANIFYGIALLVSLITIGIASFDLVPKDSPFIINKLWNALRKAVFPTVLFIFVMYASVLPKQWKFTKTLMNLRGELSIIAVIMTLAHNLVYLFAPRYHFFYSGFVAGDLEVNKFVALILTLIMMIIMSILAYTSFPSIRRKMPAKKWKSLQAPLSYIFYALLYLHLAFLYLGKYFIKGKGLAEFIIYTVIFASYLILKLRAVYLKRNR